MRKAEPLLLAGLCPFSDGGRTGLILIRPLVYLTRKWMGVRRWPVVSSRVYFSVCYLVKYS